MSKIEQDEVLRMAREAGLEQVVGIDPKNGTKLVKSLPPELLERFAALVAAHEREACAKVVLDDAWALTFQTFRQYRTALAAAIRNRGETK